LLKGEQENNISPKTLKQFKINTKAMQKIESIEQSGINTVRVLSAEAVQKANPGHPRTPMGLAPIGHVLWTKFMNYNPKHF
jgi:hypothetical protein